MPKELNRKDGTLRGVTGAHKLDGAKFYTTDARVQGWVTKAGEKHNFSILFVIDDENEIEITLSEPALERLLAEIDAKRLAWRQPQPLSFIDDDEDDIFLGTVY